MRKNNEKITDILRVDCDDDDKNFIQFQKLLDNTTKHQKLNFQREIIESGDEYLREIKKNNNKRKESLTKELDYIQKKSTEYTKEELIQYDISDILDIYRQLKIENRSFVSKLFHFLIGQ